MDNHKAVEGLASQFSKVPSRELPQLLELFSITAILSLNIHKIISKTIMKNIDALVDMLVLKKTSNTHKFWILKAINIVLSRMSDCESIFFRKANHVDAAVIFLNSCESVSDDIQSQIQSYFEINQINLSIVANFDRLISLAKANSQLQDNSPIDKYFNQLNDLLNRSNVDSLSWNFLSDSISLMNQTSTKNNSIKNSLFSSLQTQLYNFANTAVAETPKLDQSGSTPTKEPTTLDGSIFAESAETQSKDVDQDIPAKGECIETIQESPPKDIAPAPKFEEIEANTPVAPLLLISEESKIEENQNPPSESVISEEVVEQQIQIPTKEENLVSVQEPDSAEKAEAPIEEIKAEAEPTDEQEKVVAAIVEEKEKSQKGSVSKPADPRPKIESKISPPAVAKRNRNEPVVIIQHEIPRKTQLLLWTLEFVVFCLILYISLRTC